MVDFKVGDVVQLKSGGPKMTVTKVGKDDCYCLWFSSDGKPNGGPFKKSFLCAADEQTERK